MPFNWRFFNRRAKANIAMLLCGCFVMTLVATPLVSWAEPAFYLQRPQLGLGLSYEFQDEERTGPTNNIETQTQEFTERLDIRTQGWLYQPDVVQFNLAFQPEWRQFKDEPDPGVEDQRDAFLPAYAADLHFLKTKLIGLHLYGKRYETTIKNAFARRSDTDTDTYGADLYLRSRLIPVTLSYKHQNLDQSGFYNTEDESDTFRLSASHRSDRSHTRLNANYSNFERTTDAGTTETKTWFGSLQNLWNISVDRRITLSSYVAPRRTEDFWGETDGLRVSERLAWQHTRKLRTEYHATYDKNKSDNFDNDAASAGASVTYEWSDNLSSRLRGEYLFTDFSDNRSETYRGKLGLNYHRSFPWGRLEIPLQWSYQYTQRNFTSDFIQVIDESHILTTAAFTVLDNRNVDLASVVVTNATGTVTYTEGIDYRLQPIDGFVRISRIVGGGIADGDEVLVDYRFTSDPEYDDSLFGQDYGLKLSLGSRFWLTYRFNHTSQEIEKGAAPDVPEDDTLHTATARYLWRWTDTRATFEDTDESSGLSTRAWMLEETLRFEPLEKTLLTLIGHYGQRHFKDDDQDEDFFGARAKLGWTPRPWCHLGIEAYREEISGDLEERSDTGALAYIELAHHIWRCNITIEYVDENDDLNNDSRTRQRFFAEIIRIVW